MHYTQTHTLQEMQPDGSAQPVRVCFVVADAYIELFSSDGVSEHDIVVLDSVKQDLNIKSGAFAVDELQFSVSGAAVETTLEEAVLTFLLGATDVAEKRYCAVFLAEGASAVVDVDNVLFCGIIKPDVTANDLLWRSIEYNKNIRPLRDWSFTAFSIEISILDEIDPYADVLDNAVPTDLQARGAFGQLLPAYASAAGTITVGDLRKVFPGSPSFNVNYAGNEPVVPHHLCVNLFSFLQALLKLAEPVVAAKFSIPLTMSLQPSPVLLRGNVAKYKSSSKDKPLQIEDLGSENFSVSMGLREFSVLDIGGQSAPGTIKPIHVDFSMCYPDYSNSGNRFNLEATSYAFDWQSPKLHPFYQKQQAGIENIGLELSYKQFKSVSALLYGVARSLGCYVSLRLVQPTELQIAFVPKQNMTLASEVFLRDALSAKITTSPEELGDSDKAKRYIGQITVFSSDEIDTFFANGAGERTESKGWDPSLALDAQAPGERLCHATNWSFVKLKDDKPQPSYPSNIVFRTPHPQDPGKLIIANGIIPLYQKFVFTNPGFVCNTGLFVAVDVGGNLYMRPVGGLVSTLNGVQRNFKNLSEYINFTESRDTAFYRTEYDIETPFLTGFSLSMTGGAPSWKHIALNKTIGRKVKLFDGFTEREYVIVGLDWRLESGSVSLKLHSSSRFGAFAPPSGSGITKTIATTTVKRTGTDSAGTNDYILHPGNKLRAGDAVVKVSLTLFGVTTTGVARYEPSEIVATLGKYIGIALNDADGDDPDPANRIVSVQESGIAPLGDLDPSATLAVGKRLYVRKFDKTLYTNISTEIVSAPNADEHVIQFIGTVKSVAPPSIKIDTSEVSSIYYNFYSK